MLKVAVCLKVSHLTEPHTFQEYEIAILNPLESIRVLQGDSGDPSIDAALFDACEASRRSGFVNCCQSSGIGVVVIAEPNDAQFGGYLREGAHGVVPANADLCVIASALWSAHRQAVLQRELSSELNALRQENENRKLIDKAVAAIAALSNISEADALRNLRHTSRNQRRPMRELAAVIVEANQILTPTLPDDNTKEFKSRVVA